jgi:excisionase family DNA binding protein
VDLSDAPLAYTVAEAATLMRISKNTVYRLIDRGELPSVRLGRRVFVSASAVRALYDDEASTGSAPIVRPIDAAASRSLSGSA